jgi:hypothetical protein
MLKEKKNYVVPSVKTVELGTSGCLLEGSKGGTIENAKLNNFNEEWE